MHLLVALPAPCTCRKGPRRIVVLIGGEPVFVCSDRIQVFGAGGRNAAAAAKQPTAAVPPAAAADAMLRDAAVPHMQRCACHDHGWSNILPRALVRPRKRTVAAPTTGIMRPCSAGLTKEIDASPEYLRASAH